MGGFGGVISTRRAARPGLNVVELLLNVNDVLDDVSAAGFGAFDFAPQLVAFGLALPDACFELLVGTAKLMISLARA